MEEKDEEEEVWERQWERGSMKEGVGQGCRPMNKTSACFPSQDVALSWGKYELTDLMFLSYIQHRKEKIRFQGTVTPSSI